MEAGTASFIPFCICVAGGVDVPPWQNLLWNWATALNVLLQISVIFYALFETDTGAALWYLMLNSTLWALALALQPVFAWIRPGAVDWFDSCDLGCSASTSYLYRPTNYYAFPDLVFVSAFVYIGLLIKWRYTSYVYIDTSIQSESRTLRMRQQHARARIPIVASATAFGFIAAYAAGEYILDRQTSIQLLLNALTCILILIAVSVADSAIRNAIYVYMHDRRRMFQRRLGKRVETTLARNSAENNALLEETSY